MRRRPAARGVARSRPGVSDMSSSFFHGRSRFPFRLASLDRFPLVVILLAFCETDGNLDAPVLEVHPDGHERHPLLLDLADQLADLLAVQEQFSATQRFM